MPQEREEDGVVLGFSWQSEEVPSIPKTKSPAINLNYFLNMVLKFFSLVLEVSSGHVGAILNQAER